MKKILVLLILFALPLLTVITASAEQDSSTELYNKQYQSSGIDEAFSLLPESTKEDLNSLGIDPLNPESFGKLDTKNIFTIIWEFISSGANKPIKISAMLIGIILIFAAGEGLVQESPGSAFYMIICFGSALIILQPAFELIKGVESALKGIATFMISFVPIYAGIMASSGLATSAGSFSYMLLLATEALTQFMSFGFVPAMGGFMCLSVSGSLSPLSGISKIAESIKKSAIWIMGLATTIFVGVLSIQTSVQAAADTLGLKTSKAVLSGSIPIMGPAIAETLATAKGCLSLLRSGAGIYGALAVLLLALPIIIELCMWRVGLWLCSGTAETFSLTNAALLFRSVDFGFSILVGAITFVALLFIISLTVALGGG